MFNEALHPRIKTGVGGGEFAGGSGAKTGTGSKPRTGTGSGTLSFNGKTGAGYGEKGGDKRVHSLQEALTRLGLTDASGKKLVDDGKLGPKTTAAVKKAQRALGLKPDGVVTPALLQKITNLKSMPKTGGAKTAPRTPHVTTTVRATPRTTARSELLLPRPTYHRTYALDSIEIQRSGDGRTVEAYAAVFDQPTEVRDEHGHYNEVIHRGAFNRTLNSGRLPVVLYNHGRTLDGATDSLAQVPIGTALDVKADSRGLFTVTRYNKSALADSVLEAIKAGDIKAQSFRGGVYGSDPPGRVPRVARGGALPTVTRTELGLSDYGPTPIPYYQGALITAVRSISDVAAELAELDDDARAELIRALQATPMPGPADSAPSYLEHGTEDTPAFAGLSGRDMTAVRRKIRTARILGGI